MPRLFLLIILGVSTMLQAQIDTRNETIIKLNDWLDPYQGTYNVVAEDDSSIAIFYLEEKILVFNSLKLKTDNLVFVIDNQEYLWFSEFFYDYTIDQQIQKSWFVPSSDLLPFSHPTEKNRIEFFGTTVRDSSYLLRDGNPYFTVSAKCQSCKLTPYYEGSDIGYIYVYSDHIEVLESGLPSDPMIWNIKGNFDLLHVFNATDPTVCLLLKDRTTNELFLWTTTVHDRNTPVSSSTQHIHRGLDLKTGFGDYLVQAKLFKVTQIDTLATNGYKSFNRCFEPCEPSELDALIFDFSDSTVEISINQLYKTVKTYSENFKFGFRNETQILTKAKYDYVWDFVDGLALVNIGGMRGSYYIYEGLWGYVDLNGNEIIPAKYCFIGEFVDDMATACLDGKYGCIDKTDKVVIPMIYDLMYSFSEGLAPVNMGIKISGGGGDEIVEEPGKWGYINKSGTMVIPLNYDSAGPFVEGKAQVVLDNQEFYIDATGKRIE